MKLSEVRVCTSYEVSQKNDAPRDVQNESTH